MKKLNEEKADALAKIGQLRRDFDDIELQQGQLKSREIELYRAPPARIIPRKNAGSVMGRAIDALAARIVKATELKAQRRTLEMKSEKMTERIADLEETVRQKMLNHDESVRRFQQLGCLGSVSSSETLDLR